MYDSTPRLAAAQPKGPFALAVATRPVLWISTKQLLVRGAVVGVRRTAVMDWSCPRVLVVLAPALSKETWDLDVHDETPPNYEILLCRHVTTPVRKSAGEARARRCDVA
jgi:hypothetical protein